MSSIIPHQKRDASLDGLRGFACLLVVMFHYVSWPLWKPSPESLAWWLKSLTSLGWCGVDLFFVLSGFLLGGRCLDTQGQPHYFSSFYARRALRILPLYFFFLVGGSLLLRSAFTGNNYGWLQRPETPIWPFVVQLQNIQMVIQNKLGPYWLSGTWSLAVEEHFYLIVPLIVHRYHRARYFAQLLLAFVLSSLVFRGALWFALEDDGLPNYILTPSRWDALFIGVLGAWMLRQPAIELWLRQHTKWLWGLLALLPGAVMVFLLPGVAEIEESLRVFVYSLLAMSFLALVLLSRYSAVTQRFFSQRWLRFLGSISYPMYLIHPLVFGLISTSIMGSKPFFTSLYQLWISLLCFIVVVFFSWMLHLTIERPLLQAPVTCPRAEPPK